MQQTQTRRARSAASCSGQARAAQSWQLVAADSRIPSMHQPLFKRLRNRAGQPTALARIYVDIDRADEIGIPIERLLHIPLDLTNYIFARRPGVARVTREMIERDLSLNAAENIASIRAREEDTAEAHDRAADAIEREIAAQMERLRAHRQRAAELRGAR